jgi:hypothetical protein
MKLRWKAGFSTTALVCALAGASAAPAEAPGEFRRSLDVSELELRNLIGQITITGHAGPGFEVVVTPGGKDAGEDVPAIEVVQDGRRAEVAIRFPSSQRFVYPALGSGSTSRFDPEEDRDRGWLGDLVHGLFGKQVSVSGSGSGLEVWADVEVRVPAGSSLAVRHGVGRVAADGVAGRLDLEIRSGGIDARAIDGELRAQSGSGSVDVDGVEGSLSVGTGSGSVTARDVRGGSARVATGSGSVTLEGIDSDSLSVATGSGGVEAREIGAGEAAVATGSGGVSLELARMGSGPFRVATGSGRVVLVVPRGASMEVHAETGRGGIDLDLHGEVNMTRNDPDEVAFTVGGGETRVRIGTGSGGIRIVDGG